MKLAGLDIGDVWTGIAISDAAQMFARPHSTTHTKELIPALIELVKKEQISAIVVGYPKTMRGTISDQTKLVQAQFEELKTLFGMIEWVLWDERLSSRRADTLKKAQTKDAKIASHAIAAAFILSSYLDHQAFMRAE